MRISARAITSRGLYGYLYCVWFALLSMRRKGIICKRNKEKNKVCRKYNKEKCYKTVVTVYSGLLN